jgi:hypothetical protein
MREYFKSIENRGQMERDSRFIDSVVQMTYVMIGNYVNNPELRNQMSMVMGPVREFKEVKMLHIQAPRGTGHTHAAIELGKDLVRKGARVLHIAKDRNQTLQFERAAEANKYEKTSATELIPFYDLHTDRLKGYNKFDIAILDSCELHDRDISRLMMLGVDFAVDLQGYTPKYNTLN